MVATTKTPPDAPETTDATESAEPHRYAGMHEVLTDGVVLKTGEDKKHNDIVEFFRRGARVKLDEDVVDIEDLIRRKIVKPADDGKKAVRTTAKALTLADGGEPDKIKPPPNSLLEEGQPMVPSAEQIQNDQ